MSIRWSWYEIHLFVEHQAQCVFICLYNYHRRSQWSRGLWRGSAAARLLGLWVRILPGAWMSVCCECCVLSGRGLCDELIIRPEQSYRLWYVVVCDLETSLMKRHWITGGCRAKNKQLSPHTEILSLNNIINRLTPNDPYMGRTAPLTSKRCILYIYSTNVGTEYFKPALHSPFFLFKMQFVP